MDEFKIQVVRQQKIIKVQPSQATLAPDFRLEVETLSCLNYPIETLTQIIEAHFEEDGEQQKVQANLIVKSLKIISISLKDSKLSRHIQQILQANLHKRKLLYQLFVYWGTCVTDVMPLLDKISAKLKFKVLAALFSTHYFTSSKKYNEIYKMLRSFVNKTGEIEKQQFLQGVKDEYLLNRSPLKIFLDTLILGFRKGNNRKIESFMNKLLGQILDSKQSQQIVRELLSQYFQPNLKQIKIDIFFKKFENLSPIFIKILKKSLENPEKILFLWANSSKFNMEVQIKTAIREWINIDRNYWRLFDGCYSAHELIPTRLALFQIGQQLMSEKVVSQCIIKKYLYGYFEGMNFLLEKQNAFLQEIGKNKNLLSSHALQSLGEMIRSQSQCSSKGGVNLICINIMSAPKQWAIFDVMKTQFTNISKLSGYFEKITAIFEKLQKKCEKKSQKVELAFYVITVEIKTDKQSIIAHVSFDQLIDLIKDPKKQIYGYQAKAYFPYNAKKAFAENKQTTQKKDFHGIVIQAFLVKSLKRSKHSLKKEDLFKSVNMPEELCSNALKKLLDKGFAEQVGENEEYRYVP